jgi:hypothetical protein
MNKESILERLSPDGTSLNLDYSEVKDLRPLAGLRTLESLGLSCTV